MALGVAISGVDALAATSYVDVLVEHTSVQDVMHETNFIGHSTLTGY